MKRINAVLVDKNGQEIYLKDIEINSDISNKDTFKFIKNYYSLFCLELTEIIRPKTSLENEKKNEPTLNIPPPQLLSKLKSNFSDRKNLLCSSDNLEKEQKIRVVVNSVFENFKESLIVKLLCVSEKNVKCRRCLKVISGIYYSCIKCSIYYLCSCCEENELHPHVMLKKRPLA